MEAVIKTNDIKTFQKILEYLKSLHISVYTKRDKDISGKFKSKQEFESLAGLWKDRSITLEDLRSQAWPARKW